MASNLRRKLPSSAVFHVYDVSAEACQRFVEEYSSYGEIKVAISSKDLANGCSTLLSSLPSTAIVRKVYLDTESGVIAANGDADRLMLEASTIDIEATQEVGQTLMEAGLGHFVDATVSGGAWGATGRHAFFHGEIRTAVG